MGSENNKEEEGKKKSIDSEIAVKIEVQRQRYIKTSQKHKKRETYRTHIINTQQQETEKKCWKEERNRSDVIKEGLEKWGGGARVKHSKCC